MLSISSLFFAVHFLISSFFCLISFFFLIVFKICFSFLPFYCFQFHSSLPQYSLLYLLSNYPNNFLAVNLSSNSLCLNIPSLCSCLATSSMSYQYSFSNSSIVFFVFFKFSLSSQVLDSAINPF